MNNKDRDNVTVTVFDGSECNHDWPFNKLKEAIQWFQQKLDEVPIEYRDSTTCEIGSETGWEDSHYGHIEIKYMRPETDAELNDRLAAYRRSEEVKRQQELATLRALEAKYRT